MAKQKKEKQKKNIWVRLGVAAAVLALLAASVLLLLRLKPAGGSGELEEEWKTPDYLRSKTMNILVAGIDYDETREVANTDVILLVSVDLEGKKIAALQIPRDTYVGEDLVKYGKINGLYNWGYKDGDGDTGISVLAETICDQFAITIDNYVTVDMAAFQTLVNMLGGVEVTLETQVTLFNDTVLEPGTHVLDGETAEWFVRNRDYRLADIDRLKMQRVFFGGLLNKLFTTPRMELLSLITAVYEYMETDLTVQEMLELALTAQGFSASDITIIRTPGEPVAAYGIYGLDVWTLHKAELADILNTYMRPYTDAVPAEELGAIELQNTTSVLNDEGAQMDDYT